MLDTKNETQVHGCNELCSLYVYVVIKSLSLHIEGSKGQNTRNPMQKPWMNTMMMRVADHLNQLTHLTLVLNPLQVKTSLPLHFLEGLNSW